MIGRPLFYGKVIRGVACVKKGKDGFYITLRSAYKLGIRELMRGAVHK